MYTYEILTQLNKYKSRDKVRLHVPGHKCAWDFKIKFPVAPIDFTELSFSDDLNCPTGVIKKAQDDLAEIVGAAKAYITTDGSSSGVMAMMFTAQFYGSKIIVPRNSHKSVFNACRILNIEPVIVQGEEKEGILLPPSPELIETLIVNDITISGLIIASPDYYGNIAPLEEYAKVLKKHSRLLFVDGAHGAHLALSETREGYAGKYADAWVDGAHKCLPTLTQGALVCVNDEALIPRMEEALSIFRTTSPSYPVMASVEYGYKYFANNPKLYNKARSAVIDFAEALKKDFTLYPSLDWTKLIIDTKPLDIDAELICQALQKKGIYAEMNDGRYILFYLSPSVDAASLESLRSALLSVCANKKLRGTYRQNPPLPKGSRTYSFLYAFKQKSEWVPLSEAVGRMCAGNAGITPPCFPVVIAGEIITKEAVALLSSARATFGIMQGKIKAVKK